MRSDIQKMRPTVYLSLAEQSQAIDWLRDCYWENYDDIEWDDLTEPEIRRAVSRYWDGGLASFLETCHVQ